MKINLKFQLDYLPVGAHYNNLRYIFKKEVWQVIVANIREFKKYKCEYCNRQFNSENTKSLKYLHCHEQWTFNYERQQQILTDLLLLCNNCHNCQHINFAALNSQEDKTIAHFKKVNNLTTSDFNELKRKELLFRKNYLDKNYVSRQDMDHIETWFFKMGVNLEAIFVNKVNAKKIQDFLENISNLNG